MSFSVFLVYTSWEKKQPKTKTNLIHRTFDSVPPVLGNKNTLPPLPLPRILHKSTIRCCRFFLSHLVDLYHLTNFLKQMLRGDPKVDAISTRYCAIASLPHTLRHNMPLTVKMSPRWSGPKGAKTKTSNRFFEQKIINEPEERAKLNFLHLQPPKKKYKNGRIFYFSSPLKGHWNNWAWIIVVYLGQLCTFAPDITWYEEDASTGGWKSYCSLTMWFRSAKSEYAKEPF